MLRLPVKRIAYVYRVYSHEIINFENLGFTTITVFSMKRTHCTLILAFILQGLSILFYSVYMKKGGGNVKSFPIVSYWVTVFPIDFHSKPEIFEFLI